MKRFILPALSLAALVTLTGPAAAGEGCAAPTQTCLDHVAASLADRGWVGIELERADDNTMTVLAVVPDSPAAAAGLRAGDRLVGLDGLHFAQASEKELQALQGGMTPGRTIEYAVMRSGRERPVRVTLGEMPDRVRYQIVGHHMLQHAKAPATTQASYGDDHAGHDHAENALPEMSIADVSRLVRRNQAVVLDANNPMTRERFGSIPRATLLTSADSYDVRRELPADRDTTLVFYCANTRCTASDVAAKRAMKAGYEHVYVLRPGIKGWTEAGLPTNPVS